MNRSISVARPMSSRHGRLLALMIVLPFAASYFVSYMLRTINALIADPLTEELKLRPAGLGLLTSIYFLAMAVAQIPLGILLDRFGPRRVQSACLLVTALGCGLFAISHSLSALIAARAMIGLGVAVALMAGVKAVVMWLRPDRLGTANGVLVMLGALGAVTATIPAQVIVDAIGWRGLFAAVAAAALFCAVTVMAVVPEPKATARPAQVDRIPLSTIYRDARFWKMAPMSATCIGTAWSLQGLWVAPWLEEVEHFGHSAVVERLFLMAVVLSVSGLALGWLSDRLRPRGIPTEILLCATSMLSIGAQLSLILHWPIPSVVSWSLVAVTGAGSVLSFAILPDYFPKHLSGRASTALNLMHLIAAFAIQWLTGVLVGHWSKGGHEMVAYQMAFSINVALQVLALTWFLWPEPRHRQTRDRLMHRLPLLFEAHRSSANNGCPYRQAQLRWLQHVADAERQLSCWRYAAIGSATVCILLVSLVVPNPFGMARPAESSYASLTIWTVPDAALEQMAEQAQARSEPEQMLPDVPPVMRAPGPSVADIEDSLESDQPQEKRATLSSDSTDLSDVAMPAAVEQSREMGAETHNRRPVASLYVRAAKRTEANRPSQSIQARRLEPPRYRCPRPILPWSRDDGPRTSPAVAWSHRCASGRVAAPVSRAPVSIFSHCHRRGDPWRNP